MRAFKIALFVLIGLVVSGAVAAGVLYLVASAVPGAYRPPKLSPEERAWAAKRFASQVFWQFHNESQKPFPFTMTFDQKDINDYLASMDEIINELPGPNTGKARKAMDKAGISGPMVVLKKDLVTLMAYSTEYDKVVSVDLAFALTEDKRLRVRVAGARVGLLAMPGFLVRRVLNSIKEKLPKGEPASAERADGKNGESVSHREVGRLLQAVAAAMNEDPISTVHGLSRRRQVRVRQIEIADGRVTIHYDPHGRKVKAAAGNR